MTRIAGSLVSGALLAAALGALAPPASAAYRQETLPFTLDDGRKVTAQLRIPARARGRLPAVMLFGGFQRGERVLDLVKTDTPLIWANLNYPFDPPRKFVFPDSFRYAPEMRDGIHNMFEGVDRLYAALKARPDVDPRRITIVGASAGAPFATVGAAKNGIPGVILVQGFAQVRDVVQHLFVRKLEPKYGAWVKGPAWLVATWIHWYCRIPDIAGYARQMKAGQKVLLFTAADDDYIPRPASDAIWDALQESKAHRERIVQPGRHMRGKEEEVAEILKSSLVWMEQQGLL